MDKSTIYQEVTERIVKQLESGIIPWHKPWCSVMEGCISHATGKPYSILNQLLLGMEGEYVTFNQCHEEGGHVKKGEKSTKIIRPIFKEVEREDEEGKKVKVRIVTGFTQMNVFHISQCDGIEPKHVKSNINSNAKSNDKAEGIILDYVGRSGITFNPVESNRAYYSPSLDTVVVPIIKQYETESEYYSTAFHEITHSTGHEKRLNRIKDIVAFGSETYSKEELCAEIGSAIMMNYCGLENEASFTNSAGYIQGWLKALKDDISLVFNAASQAEKAVKYILGNK